MSDHFESKQELTATTFEGLYKSRELLKYTEVHYPKESSVPTLAPSLMVGHTFRSRWKCLVFQRLCHHPNSSILFSEGGGTMPFPQRHPHPILATCKYVILHAQRDFEIWLCLLTLKWGNILNFPCGPNLIILIVRNRGPFLTLIEMRDRRKIREIQVCWLWWWRKSPGTKDRRLIESGKCKKMKSQCLQRGSSPPSTGLAQWGPCQISDT